MTLLPLAGLVALMSHPAEPARDDLGSRFAAKTQLQDSNGQSVNWQGVLTQSGFLLGVQHTLRMSQTKTRFHLDGPFWHDYVESVRGLKGWDDGNSVTTNYLGHPMMGAVTGFVWIQNDPRGRNVAWNPKSKQYWASRARGMAWSAVYSTTFELAPWGEAGIGNVGYDRGTMGFVDLVVTPLGGLGLMVLEDWLDATLIRRIERGGSAGWARVARVVFNPSRSVANMMRLDRPSHRDTRGRREP